MIDLQPAPVGGDGRDGPLPKSFLVVSITGTTGLTSLDIRPAAFRWFGKDLRRRGGGGRWFTRRSPRRVGHESRVSLRVRFQCRRLSNTKPCAPYAFPVLCVAPAFGSVRRIMVRSALAARWIRTTLITSRSSDFLGVGRGHEARCDVPRLSYRQSPTKRTATQG